MLPALRESAEAPPAFDSIPTPDGNGPHRMDNWGEYVLTVIASHISWRPIITHCVMIPATPTSAIVIGATDISCAVPDLQSTIRQPYQHYHGLWSYLLPV